MRKFYSIFALCAFLFLSVSIQATDYTVEPKADGNDPVKSRAVPLRFDVSGTWGSVSQQIYLASELADQGAGAGDINAITFYYSASSTISSNPTARDIQIFLMQISAEQNAFAIKANGKSDFLYVSNTNKTPGTRVYNGTLVTEAVTSSQTKTVKINFDNSFSWDGLSNLVLTVFDKSATSNTVSAGGFANIRFLISKTGTPRFLSKKWYSSGTYYQDTDDRDAWIADISNNLNGREGEYWTSSAATDVATQSANRSYVNKVTFSISAAIPAPTNLAASSITASSATLSWDAVAGATSYNVRWGKTSGSLDHSQNNVAATSLAISGLDDGETYYFDVQTVTAGGTSAFSSEANFNTAAVTHEHDGITFNKWSMPTSLPTSGNYYLNADVAYDFYEGGYLDLAGDLNLCLNGHTIDLGTKSINVTNGHTMTLFDHVGGGKITGFVAGDNGTYTFQGVISVENGGTLVLREGEVENTYPAGDPEYKSIAIASGGTLIISGEPAISSNEIDIFLAPTIPAKVITIESGKPLTNSTPYKVYKSDGVLTSGWANMSGADPKDHFVSANPNKIVCLKDGEAALRTALNLSESSDNDAIGDNYNQTVVVAITRSTLTSASYNTICLPFALSNAQLEEVFGVGYDLEELTGSSLDGDELTLTFDKVTALEAGKPYLLQPSVEVTNPSFEGVTIGATAPVDIETSLIDFKGTFNPTELEVGNHNILCLGASNSLFWPNTSNPIKGFRAYFEVKGAAQKAKAAHIVKKEDQAQALDNIENTRPAQKRILNGQLVIEKNGTLYNAQGQIVK